MSLRARYIATWSATKTPKNPTCNRQNVTPTPEKKIGFPDGRAGAGRAGTSNPYTSKKILYLYFMYEIELQNRIKVGFCLGFGIYPKDKDFDFSEYILYLGLISLHIKIF